MASRQAKEERAEVAARIAASDLRDVNPDREREREYEAAGERAATFDTTDQPQQLRPGVIGSILRAVHDSYEHAKEAVVGKSHDAAKTAHEGAEYTADRSREGCNAATGKAKEYKDYTTEKTKETTDSAAQKVKEKTGEVADKAKEGKDTTVGKLGELKDSAADAERRAMDMLSGKEETKEKTYDCLESAKEKLRETEEEARRKMEELRKEKEYEDDATRRARENKEAWDKEGDRGKEESGGILGMIGSVTGAIKEKLTQPTDKKNESHVAGRDEGEGRDQRAEAEKVVEVYVEDTPPGATASTLKVADQMSRQTFNNVGHINDEGVLCVTTDRHCKM